MNEMTVDLEAKLLAILNEPEATQELVDTIEKVSEGNETELSEEARATLAALLNAGMPTPQEIIRDAEIAAHNDQKQQARIIDLARRKERRSKQEKFKKHRRR